MSWHDVISVAAELRDGADACSLEEQILNWTDFNFTFLYFLVTSVMNTCTSSQMFP